MGITRRILANLAVVAIAAGGLVAVTEAPAVADTYRCTYKALANDSQRVRAENHGYGVYGECYYVRARAQDDTGGALYFRYGPISGSVSKVSSIGYPLVFRQTNAAPVTPLWGSWSGVNGIRSVTVSD